MEFFTKNIYNLEEMQPFEIKASTRPDKIMGIDDSYHLHSRRHGW